MEREWRPRMGQSRPRAHSLTGKSCLEKEPVKRLRKRDQKPGMSTGKDGVQEVRGIYRISQKIKTERQLLGLAKWRTLYPL